MTKTTQRAHLSASMESTRQTIKGLGSSEEDAEARQLLKGALYLMIQASIRLGEEKQRLDA